MRWNRTIVLCAAAAFVLAAAAMVVPRLAGSVRGLFAPKSYDWVSKTMAACEEDAVTQPSSVNFLVVPLEPSRRFGKELESKAIETFGRTMLFGSQDALSGLKSGALRISSKHYVLHTLDTSNNSSVRWNSASRRGAPDHDRHRVGWAVQGSISDRPRRSRAGLEQCDGGWARDLSLGLRLVTRMNRSLRLFDLSPLPIAAGRD